MRQIGKIEDQESATRLIAFLLTEEIKAVAEKGDAWEIWIKEEDDVPRARDILAEFQKDPQDAKYAKAIETANRIAREQLEQLEKTRKNVVVMRSNWSNSRPVHKPLTVLLIILSVAVFMTTRGWEYAGMFGRAQNEPEQTSVLKALLFVNPDEALLAVNRRIKERLEEFDRNNRDQTDPDEMQRRRESFIARVQFEALNDMNIKMHSIRQGQFWRLFTPMFIHFGLVHILFNMMWLHMLGSQFEDKLGTARFGVFVLTAAVVSVVVQMMMPTNMQGTSALTLMGGMSGVNFALGGFNWMKSVYEPASGFRLGPIAMFSLILVLFIGIVDGGQSVSIANWAHGAGFVFGLACGYLPILRSRSLK